MRLLAEEGHEVVAATADAEALIAAVAADTPDIVVADVRMPPTHTDEGLRAVLQIRQRHPGVAVLVLSQYVEKRYATELLASDPVDVGYLLKDRVARSRSSWTHWIASAPGARRLTPKSSGSCWPARRTPTR